MNSHHASYWIKRLDLWPHPEGGYYKEIFRSELQVHRINDSKIKQACTSIYYLLEGSDFSGFHRLASDELWYFHAGVPLIIHVIAHNGEHLVLELSDLHTGNLSLIIPANTWFAAEVSTRDGFTLVSCAVAPAFDFSEFEMADHKALTALYPQHGEIIKRLCHL